MARFDVHRDRDGSLLLDVQTDSLPYLAIRLMVPLFAIEVAPHPLIATLNPVFQFAGGEVAMMTQYAGAVPQKVLGPVLGSLAAEACAIGRALDMLITGI
ncbi:MAG: plasmid maintenance protein CcdB [Sphingomonas sp.]|uniref:CcdB family protein n=1 Tax=Sphingomonas sp. TaxID=28214 RepID=UPI0012005DA1|nr:CcdB family protein [Sphingomonas sp.]THD36744.1 MAG: plasmid maintenance protein CcdB [Sphingomonas sp.]